MKSSQQSPWNIVSISRPVPVQKLVFHTYLAWIFNSDCLRDTARKNQKALIVIQFHESSYDVDREKNCSNNNTHVCIFNQTRRFMSSTKEKVCLFLQMWKLSQMGDSPRKIFQFRSTLLNCLSSSRIVPATWWKFGCLFISATIQRSSTSQSHTLSQLKRSGNNWWRKKKKRNLSCFKAIKVKSRLSSTTH